MKKKALIITYYWPPSGGAGVQRWLKFAKYLPEYGWEPVIYTPSNPEVPAIDNSLMKDADNIDVIKTPIWEPYTFYKRFTGRKSSEKINAGFIKDKNTNETLENISTFIRGNFFIPDARKFWIKPSVKFLLKYVKDNKIDVIISTGPPHSMHLIALKLKQKTGIKWVADFRDPWTNIDFYKDLKLTKRSDRKHRNLENKVLTNADCVISVGQTLSNELKSIGAKNIYTITNGFDANDIPNIKPQLDREFTILHIGSINRDRDHEIFWNAIKELITKDHKFKQNLRIKFIGKVDVAILNKIDKLMLKDNFSFIEYMSHDKIIAELMKAQLLYLPINNTPNAKGILTGKFFEYLASKRPILAIGLLQSDIAEILNKTKAGKIFGFEDKEGVGEYIYAKFNDFTENKNQILDSGIDEYSRTNLSKKLSDLLNTVVDDK
jgi:glycosyltransferase involved in cell wall biosynthesis